MHGPRQGSVPSYCFLTTLLKYHSSIERSFLTAEREDHFLTFEEKGGRPITQCSGEEDHTKNVAPVSSDGERTQNAPASCWIISKQLNAGREQTTVKNWKLSNHWPRIFLSPKVGQRLKQDRYCSWDLEKRYKKIGKKRCYLFNVLDQINRQLWEWTKIQ